MSKKVSIWKCKRCVHFSSHCPLEDLEPCRYVRRRDPEEDALDFILACVTIIGLGLLVWCFFLY